MRRLALAAVLILAACGDDGPDKYPSLYDTAPVPAVPAVTAEVDPDSDPPGDGDYWATATDATTDTLTFRLTQAFAGDACTERFGTGPDACPSGIGVLDPPAASLTTPAATISAATVVATDQVNYAVTGAELARLVMGEPAATPPEVTFTYTPFPFVVSVRDGQVIRAQQIWLP